jgi:hypothetical protein
MYARMAGIAVEIRWARFCDYGAGRMPSVLYRLANGA